MLVDLVFQVSEYGNNDDYFKKQYKKFFIMYLYYKIKTRDLEMSKKDFYESLESYFENSNTTEAFLEFDTSLRFSLNLMYEVGRGNPKMLITSLKSLHQSFVTADCELKRNITSFNFYAEEKLFNDLRTFLISLINDTTNSKLVQELALKLILLIGNLRGSGEDFLIVYNLIHENKFDFNIDTELSQCKFIETKHEGTGTEANTLKVSYEGSKAAYILKGDDCNIDFDNTVNLTFDSDHAYAFQGGKGVFKLGISGSVSTKLGSLYWKNTGLSDDSTFLMHYDGKLFCRKSDSDGKPFVLLNKETLEEITDNEEFNKKMEALKPKTKTEGDVDEDNKTPEVEEDSKDPNEPRLEWTKIDDDEEKKEGRYLCESPLITDGTDFYVISTMREIKIIKKEEEDLDEDKKELKIHKWILEIYDGSTWKHKKSIDLKLELKPKSVDEVLTEEEEKHIENVKKLREKFSMENITKCNYATNGNKLLVGDKEKWHVFNLDTEQWTFNQDILSNSWSFDPATNTFWKVSNEGLLKSFKIPAFRRIETKDTTSKGIIEYINARVKDIQVLQTVDTKVGKWTPKTLFKSLLHRPEEQAENHFEIKTKYENSLFLIMNILKEGSKDLITMTEDINPNGPVDGQKLELFRGSFTTSVTNTFFTELIKALEKSVALISKEEKKSSNILSQYNFYMLLILVETSMMCLSKLNLNLSTVLYDTDDYEKFLKILQNSVNVLVSKDHPTYVFEEGDNHDELACLWKSIELECRSIMAFCLSFIYESLNDLMKKIIGSLDRLESSGEIDNSLGIYIRYLTLPETMSKALKDKAELSDLVLLVYEKLCKFKTKKLVSAMESLRYDQHNLDVLTYNTVETNSEDFIYAVTQNIIHQYFEAYSEVESEKANAKVDKDKLDKLERKLNRIELDLIKILERISESSITILETCSQTTQYYLDEAIKQQKEDEKIEDEDKKPKKTGKDKYIEYHRYLYRVAKDNNNFMKLLHVYVASFASLRESINVKTLSLLAIKILKVIETFSQFKEVKSEDLEISESEDLYRQYIDKDIMKFLVWTISKLSYSFINVKEKKDTELSEEEKMNKKILDSKLLSGGIENRYLYTLSKSTVTSLRELCEITSDKTIKEHIDNPSQELDEDQVYSSIIHPGKDENVDRIIDLLQFSLERKHIWATIGKDEGMRLSRAAFACMVKIGQLYTDFVMMVDETEMNASSAEGDEVKVKKALLTELEKMDNYETMFKRWESSARMRSWYQEKKKSWANKVKKEEEDKKKKEGGDNEDTADKDKKEEKKDAKTEDNKDEEETIETTKKPESKVDPKKKTKDQLELAKIVDKIVEKAELLVKLSMPTLWGMDDQGKLMIIESLTEQEEKQKSVKVTGSAKEDEKKSSKDKAKEEQEHWNNVLQEWKTRQTSAGSIKDFRDENANVFSSSTSSILACLQSPISAQRIKKQIETIYLSAMKRI